MNAYKLRSPHVYFIQIHYLFCNYEFRTHGTFFSFFVYAIESHHLLELYVKHMPNNLKQVEKLKIR